MRKIVLDTNCLLMSLPRISPYRKIWDDFGSYWLITCTFLVIFLVVSRKSVILRQSKRLKGEDYGIRDKKHSCFDR